MREKYLSKNLKEFSRALNGEFIKKMKKGGELT